ncbi:MAG: VanZ family protein [Gammaproteobacteria bacterium]|jgi:VanZ family protein
MREDLRWFKLWLVMGWLLVATVIYLSLTPHPIEIDVNHGDKIGHTLAYFGMMFWFAQLYRRRSHVWWGAGFIALGVSLEYLQGWSGYRDFEYLDMVADASGVAAAWLLAGTAAARLLNGLERLIRP